MKHLKLSLIATAFLALGLSACSEQKPGATHQGHQQPSSPWEFWKQDAQVLTIVGPDQQPLANAKILIGQALDNPFQGNFLTTDANGNVQIPAAWTSNEVVTIEAPGYLRATYFGVDPMTRTFRLRKLIQVSAAEFEVAGVTKGHNVVDKDGYIDFGLIIPALTRADLLSFDLNSVVSPQTDKISIVGQEAEVPSNITLPRQKESYVLPITIEKPNYRMYFQEEGVQRVFAARGRFHFKTVVGELRNKTPFQELINHFKISGGGIRDIEVKGQKSALDMPVNELNFSGKMQVMAPSISSDETMISLGVAQQTGYLIPTDVKRLTSGQKMEIASLEKQDAFVLSILKKTKEMENANAPGADRLSASLISADNGTVTPSFLPLMGNPSLANNGDILIPRIDTIAGVTRLATYSILSQVIETKKGTDKVTKLQRAWEVYAPDWQMVLALPEWPNAPALPGKKRWEVNYIGSLTASQVELGPAMINSATHVTHSSIDF